MSWNRSLPVLLSMELIWESKGIYNSRKLYFSWLWGFIIRRVGQTGRFRIGNRSCRSAMWDSCQLVVELRMNVFEEGGESEESSRVRGKQILVPCCTHVPSFPFLSLVICSVFNLKIAFLSLSVGTPVWVVHTSYIPVIIDNCRWKGEHQFSPPPS